MLQQLARRRGVGGGGDAKAGAGQIFLQQVADAVVVVDDQQVALRGDRERCHAA